MLTKNLLSAAFKDINNGDRAAADALDRVVRASFINNAQQPNAALVKPLLKIAALLAQTHESKTISYAIDMTLLAHINAKENSVDDLNATAQCLKYIERLVKIDSMAVGRETIKALYRSRPCSLFEDKLIDRWVAYVAQSSPGEQERQFFDLRYTQSLPDTRISGAKAGRALARWNEKHVPSRPKTRIKTITVKTQLLHS